MTVRDSFVALVRSYAGLVASPNNASAIRRYQGLIQAPGYEQKSGCGLVIRGYLWRFLANPPPRLGPPYKDGAAISDLIAVAMSCDALVRVGGARKPQPGDICHDAQSASGCEHVWVMTELDGDNCKGVDGGQREGGFSAILEQERQLDMVNCAKIWDRKKSGVTRALVDWIDIEKLAACRGLSPEFAEDP